MGMELRWYRVDQFLNRPIVSFFAAGCILLLCSVIIFGGLAFVGSFYAFPQQNPNTLTPPAKREETPTPQFLPEKPTNIPPTPTGPQGKIVYVCQIFTDQARDQICVMNADGSGQRRLTTDDNARHFYPSFAPDGKSVLFSSNMNGNFELYEFVLATDQLIRLGKTVGVGPEISPDNRSIVYARNDGIWAVDRQGLSPHQIYKDGWDATWSPDGSLILFATTVKSEAQLATIRPDGTDFRILTDVRDMRGRNDWSSDGLHLVTYLGKPWERNLFIMNADGSNVHQVSPPGGNSQGPSFSPDGQWIAFTAYFDHYRINNGCEIYIVRIDGSGLTRLTDNDYCDWQPRWGP